MKYIRAVQKLIILFLLLLFLGGIKESWVANWVTIISFFNCPSVGISLIYKMRNLRLLYKLWPSLSGWVVKQLVCSLFSSNLEVSPSNQQLICKLSQYHSWFVLILVARPTSNGLFYWQVIFVQVWRIVSRNIYILLATSLLRNACQHFLWFVLLYLCST